MPIEVRSHSFERSPNNRVRDVSFYKCTKCGSSARIYSRQRTPLEQLLADAVKADCTGEKPAAQPTMQEALDVIRALLKSAHPHPVEHPTMTAAWKKAEAFLARFPQE
jgi:hypothetical protein